MVLRRNREMYSRTSDSLPRNALKGVRMRDYNNLRRIIIRVGTSEDAIVYDSAIKSVKFEVYNNK